MNNCCWINCDISELPDWWNDWTAQQRNALREPDLISTIFNVSDEVRNRIKKVNETRRIQITPYVSRLIFQTLGKYNGAPEHHPLFLQYIPIWSEGTGTEPEYDGYQENWEKPEEMVTPILQHKYDDRAIIRLTNSCFGYCQFCYEALRTLERSSHKNARGFSKAWSDTVSYIEQHSEISEVILSGGDPLLLSNETLRDYLTELRKIRSDLIIRIHTRALTFNPFRVNDELLQIITDCNVATVGVHIAHPLEITEEFKLFSNRLRSSGVALIANIPLLRSINDNSSILRTLFVQLYSMRIVPHYLYQFMPYSPGWLRLAVPIRRGIKIMRALERNIIGPALPKYVLPHYTGKYTVPYQLGDEAGLIFGTDKDGNGVVSFTNWKGEHCIFYDTDESSLKLSDGSAKKFPIENEQRNFFA